MTFNEIRNIRIPFNSYVSKSVSIACDGSNDRPRGEWSGTLNFSVAGRTVGDMIDYAVSSLAIKWQTAHRSKIPSLGGVDEIDIIVPAPHTRASAPVTPADVERHIASSAISIADLERMLAAKRVNADAS